MSDLAAGTEMAKRPHIKDGDLYPSQQKKTVFDINSHVNFIL